KDEDDSKEARIVREVAIMLLLHHPHIALMHEVILQDDNYYLFLEHVDGGQMLDYMINHGKLKEKHARKFLRQIVSAIDYCHQNSIVHRDLKIENVLIDKEGSIKLIDFGLSNMYAPSHQLSTFCGSLYFAAPELLSAKAYTGPEVDIWSLGVILYVLVCGKVPFDDVSMPVLHSKIKAGVVEYPSHLSEACKHLISRLLVTQPNRRATMAELKNHVWLTEGYDGPPDNYMPPREPLTLPLDMEVIERIRGFEFGTEASVATALETHISN
ncbi:kinase-like domain-containing protein, partial [Powellomyces hirtus]